MGQASVELGLEPPCRPRHHCASTDYAPPAIDANLAIGHHGAIGQSTPRGLEKPHAWPARSGVVRSIAGRDQQTLPVAALLQYQDGAKQRSEMMAWRHWPRLDAMSK